MIELFRKNIKFLLLENQPEMAGISERLSVWLKSNDEVISISLLQELSSRSGFSIDRLFKHDLSILPNFRSDIKMVIFDIDGVMTDAGMYYTESGDEFKKFNARDGLAIRKLTKSGMVTGVISHGINEKLIKKRCDLLGISNVYAGPSPKQDILAKWCSDFNISFQQVAFIGDDVNDLPLMRIVGFSACPSDAAWPVKDHVDMILTHNGGQGAVREWIERCFINMDSV